MIARSLLISSTTRGSVDTAWAIFSLNTYSNPPMRKRNPYTRNTPTLTTACACLDLPCPRCLAMIMPDPCDTPQTNTVREMTMHMVKSKAADWTAPSRAANSTLSCQWTCSAQDASMLGMACRMTVVHLSQTNTSCGKK